MFNSNLVVALKVNGKVLREFDDTVALPFGSEYVILIKNLSTRRAKLKLTIDGKDALDGNLVVQAQSSVELKRFVTSNNMDSGNAFKYIEKTKNIEKYRGNSAEDGLITVVFEFERNTVWTTPAKPTYPDYPSYPNYPDTVRYKTGDILQYTTTTGVTGSVSSSTVRSVYNANNVMNADEILCMVNHAPQASATLSSGITAPGSIVSQSFKPVYDFVGDGALHSMTIKMVGLDANSAPVKEAITVKKLLRCSMCGVNTKHTSKFCSECGASVQVV